MMARIILGLVALVTGAVAAEGDLTVQSSSGSSIILEYHPQYLEDQNVAGTDFTLVDFVRSEQGANERRTGAPDVRYRFAPLVFPGLVGTTVRVLAADYEDVHNVLLAPVPSYKSDDGMLTINAYRASSIEYTRSDFFPEQIAALDGPSRSGDRILGGVKFFPFQYNPVSRTLRKYSRILVEVSYGPSQVRTSKTARRTGIANVTLNRAAAQDWIVPLPVTAAPGPSVLSTGTWYRLSIDADGIYKLDRQYLSSLGVSVGSIDPRQIRIYGNGGQVLPENPSTPRPDDLLENAIYVAGEADGKFDDGDYVLFYAKGTRGWNYNPSTRLLDHYINIYTETNYYWLTVGPGQGKRMATQNSLASAADVVPQTFLDGVFTEEEKVNILNQGGGGGSGKDWFSQSLSPGGSFTYISPLPGYQSGDNLTYRYALVTRSNLSPSFVVKEGSTQIATHPFGSVSYTADGVYALRSVLTRVGPFAISNNESRLNFQFNSGSAAASGWVDWFEIQYHRVFDAVNNYLLFRSPDTTGVIEYHLNQFSAAPLLFNVTDPANVTMIPIPTMVFRDSARAGSLARYCAAGANAYKTPAASARIDNQNLHGYYQSSPDSGADFIIVTSKEFMSAAQRLKDFREQPSHGNLRTYIADVDLIYNEFGGGLPDISAIRDFLLYAYTYWPRRPQFVLMLGGCSFDYKGILGTKTSFVPIWQSQQSLDDIYSFSTDDYFVTFGSRQTLPVGRISSRKASEANTVVDKIINYEEHSALDSWNSRMLFVADDGWTPETEEYSLHSGQAEYLANNLTPDEFEKKKIYIAEYPTVQTAQGRRKPTAYQAIIDEINRGALVVNFTGHGNPTVWTHESVFEVSTSIPQLVNADKLFVFFGATCNFSEYDDPSRLTGSELMINKPDGGAIGVVSALRKVYAGSNASLHQKIFAEMFTRDAYGRLVVERPATAMQRMKASGGSGDFVNDAKYVFMGDPTMRLQFPSGYASIDGINGQPLNQTNPIQLRALETVTVNGTIRNANNSIDSTFSGSASILVNDASRPVTIVNFSPNFNWTYLATGGTVYRGENSVVNGQFRATFVVPKDISYADSSARARMVVSFESAAENGLGYTSSLRVGGTDTTARIDTEGPTMNLYLGNRSFRDGDLVNQDPMLIVDIADSSGINTSVSGIGHKIEARINNSAETLDLTDYYSSAMDNFREGTVQYQLKNLKPGRNYLELRAWDTYNNSATAQTSFQVSASGALSITDVFNYPNPFASSTTFTVRQNQLVPVDVTVKIYTLAGRLIQTLESSSPGESFIRVPWDGRDRDGDILANGVYLYKMVVKTTDGKYSSEALGKLSVLK